MSGRLVPANTTTLVVELNPKQKGAVNNGAPAAAEPASPFRTTAARPWGQCQELRLLSGNFACAFPFTALAVRPWWPCAGSHPTTADSDSGKTPDPGKAFGPQHDPKAKLKTNLPKTQWKLSETMPRVTRGDGLAGVALRAAEQGLRERNMAESTLPHAHRRTLTLLCTIYLSGKQMPPSELIPCLLEGGYKSPLVQ